MQAPHVAIGVVLHLLFIFVHVVGNARAHFFADALVYDVAARHRGTGVRQHPVEGLLGTHDADRSHLEGFVRAHEGQFRVVHFAVLVGCLYAAVPVVLRNFGEAFHDVAHSIDATELLEGEHVDATALRLDDAVGHRTRLRR